MTEKMKRVLLIVLLGIAILSTSCSSSKFFTSDVKPFEINEMIKVEPLSFISLIEKGNRGVYNDSISKIANIALNESLETFREKLRLSSEEIYVTDSLDRIELEQEIDFFIREAERNKKKKNHTIEITPLVDSLLSVNGKRFGLLILQSGFTRAKGNYGGQVAKAIGMGVLTGLATGTAYYQNPIKSGSTVYVVIVDNQEKNVTFYNKSIMQDREPTEKENITKQLQNVFEKYFWKKQ